MLYLNLPVDSFYLVVLLCAQTYPKGLWFFCLPFILPTFPETILRKNTQESPRALPGNNTTVCFSVCLLAMPFIIQLSSHRSEMWPSAVLILTWCKRLYHIKYEYVGPPFEEPSDKVGMGNEICAAWEQCVWGRPGVLWCAMLGEYKWTSFVLSLLCR